MTLNDLPRAKREDISAFRTNDDYMKYSIELYKEFFAFFSIITGIEDVCEEHLDKKKGLVFGVVRKLGNLSLDYLNLLCNGSIDSVHILSRVSKEAMVTVLLMLKHYDEDKVFEDYIKYSMIIEKKFYNTLIKDENASDLQGDVVSGKIRERMKRSVEEDFQDIGLQVESFDAKKEEKENFWSKTRIDKRFDKVGWSRGYSSYRLDCHATHSNWSNLYNYFLKLSSDGIITIRPNKIIAVPQMVLPTILLHGVVLNAIVEKFVPDCQKKTTLKQYMNLTLEEVERLDEAHEQFLQSNGNRTRA